MRITIVDPPAYTLPYDHALCAALGGQGHEVELVTSRFRHGPPPLPSGYRRTESFYGFLAGSRLAKAIQHPTDMRALARRLRREPSGVVHFQWLPIPEADALALPGFRAPRVVTAHELPRQGIRRRLMARALRLGAEAVIVHSDDASRRIVHELGLRPDRVHVVPHGAFDYLTRLPRELPLDRAVGDLEGRKVVLSFGLIRAYKAIDVLIEAFASTPEEAVLVVAGRPLMPVEPLRRRARELGILDRVRFVPRFVIEAEIPAYFRRADLVVLPYREVEQSGVLFTALAFGSPLLLSAVGSFAEIGERHGAARLVPPGDVRALGAALVELLADDAARAALSAAARRAASGPYSWDAVAAKTASLYSSLLERSP